MFAGPSEHLSEKEIREGEAKAAVEVQIFTAACLALWFCMWNIYPPRPFLSRAGKQLLPPLHTYAGSQYKRLGQSANACGSTTCCGMGSEALLDVHTYSQPPLHERQTWERLSLLRKEDAAV
ncbi:hypothetical protein LTR93_002606 [Exophiala xenobiotica]|nr:hypothetical protein LTR93_002606 [Exophiala xenobiotica]